MNTHKSPLVPFALLVLTTLAFFCLPMGIGSLYHSAIDIRFLLGYLALFWTLSFGLLHLFFSSKSLLTRGGVLAALFLGFTLFCILVTGLRYFGTRVENIPASIESGSIKTNLSDIENQVRFRERFLVLNVRFQDGTRLRLTENRPGLSPYEQEQVFGAILDEKPPLTVRFENTLPGIRLYLNHSFEGGL